MRARAEMESMSLAGLLIKQLVSSGTTVAAVPRGMLGSSDMSVAGSMVTVVGDDAVDVPIAEQCRLPRGVCAGSVLYSDEKRPGAPTFTGIAATEIVRICGVGSFGLFDPFDPLKPRQRGLQFCNQSRQSPLSDSATPASCHQREFHVAPVASSNTLVQKHTAIINDPLTQAMYREAAINMPRTMDPGSPSARPRASPESGRAGMSARARVALTRGDGELILLGRRNAPQARRGSNGGRARPHPTGTSGSSSMDASPVIGPQPASARQGISSPSAPPQDRGSSSTGALPDLSLPASVISAAGVSAQAGNSVPTATPPDAPMPDADRGGTGLLDAMPGIGPDEMYGADERALNDFLVQHPMLNLGTRYAHNTKPCSRYTFAKR